MIFGLFLIHNNETGVIAGDGIQLAEFDYLSLKDYLDSFLVSRLGFSLIGVVDFASSGFHIPRTRRKDH